MNAINPPARVFRSSLALPAACWILRVSIAIMCLGLAARSLFIQFVAETDIVEVLLYEQVGAKLVGSDWSQEGAVAVDHNGAWYYFLAGLVLLIVPAVIAAFRLLPPTRRMAEFAYRWGLAWQAPLLVFIALWGLLIAWAHAHRGGTFHSDYTIAAHAARFLTPLGLLCWIAALPRPGEIAPTFKQTAFAWTGETILRWGLAITFFLHGWEAWLRNPQFIDLILQTDRRHLHWLLTQRAAEDMLGVIGVLDMIMAVAIVSGRFRSVALWMAFWGAITAVSRVTAQGWGKYPEILLRAAHAGVPLALFVYWQWGIRRPTAPSPDPPLAEE